MSKVGNTQLEGKWLHAAIAQRVVALYEGGFYEEASFNAFKAVDHYLRTITGLRDALPQELINAAFNPATGMLKDDQVLQSEREGLYLMLKGAFMSYRNPPAHRFVDIDRQEAFDTIVLANRIYLIVEEADRRRRAANAPALAVPIVQYQRGTYDNPALYQLDRSYAVDDKLVG